MILNIQHKVVQRTLQLQIHTHNSLNRQQESTEFLLNTQSDGKLERQSRRTQKQNHQNSDQTGSDRKRHQSAQETAQGWIKWTDDHGRSARKHARNYAQRNHWLQDKLFWFCNQFEEHLQSKINLKKLKEFTNK